MLIVVNVISAILFIGMYFVYKYLNLATAVSVGIVSLVYFLYANYVVLFKKSNALNEMLSLVKELTSLSKSVDTLFNYEIQSLMANVASMAYKSEYFGEKSSNAIINKAYEMTRLRLIKNTKSAISYMKEYDVADRSDTTYLKRLVLENTVLVKKLTALSDLVGKNMSDKILDNAVDSLREMIVSNLDDEAFIKKYQDVAFSNDADVEFLS